MEKTKRTTALVMNILIAICVIFSFIAMVTDFNFMGMENHLSSPGWKAFIYFTVDSNVLMGVAAIVYILYLCFAHDREDKRAPVWMGVFKIASVTGVALTFLVTACFLGPTSSNFFSLYINSNLFMHFITPVLSIVSFVGFEQYEKIKFAKATFGIAPMLLYSVYYITNVMTHLVDGGADPHYDWYGFLFMGLWTAPIVVLLICAITYGISVSLWVGNKKVAK